MDNCYIHNIVIYGTKEGGASQCLECPDGFFSEASWPLCEPCPPGRVSTPDHTTCNKCPANHFRP
jgi:hypothetical protein